MTSKPMDPMRWAQGLIEQLPATHDGRNSWLLNYGIGPESDAIRQRWHDEHPLHPEFRAKSPPTPSGSGEVELRAALTDLLSTMTHEHGHWTIRKGFGVLFDSIIDRLAGFARQALSTQEDR